MEGYDSELRTWESIATQKLSEIQEEPPTANDLATLLVFEPKVQHEQIVKSLRLYSVAITGHPLFDSPAIMKLTNHMISTIQALSRFIQLPDKDFRNTITETDLLYALRCARVKSVTPSRIATLLEEFAGAPIPGLKTTQKPRMNYGPFLRAISPSAAELWLEKNEIGIDAASTEYDQDIEAVMVAVSVDVFKPYSALRKAIMARDTEKSGVLMPQELVDATSECGFTEFDMMDAEFALRFFHSEVDCKLDWELFLGVLAVAIDRSNPMADVYDTPM